MRCTWVVGLMVLGWSGCTPPPWFPPWQGADASPQPHWQVVLDGEDLDGVVLSIWGPPSDEVLAVGGGLGTGTPSLVVQLREGRWRRLQPGGTETYWWVHGTSAHDVWMVGERGRITHFDGQAFAEHVSGTSATLWGVWAAAPDDVWAVGGSPGEGADGPNDVVLHWDGTAWNPVSLPGPPRHTALFKVWGASREELFVVGELATIWHWRAGSWGLESGPPQQTLAEGTLLTVHGCSADDVYAVGGQSVLHFNGERWSRVDVVLPSVVNGVSCRDGAVVLSGMGGLKMHGTPPATFTNDSDLPPPPGPARGVVGRARTGLGGRR